MGILTSTKLFDPNGLTHRASTVVRRRFLRTADCTVRHTRAKVQGLYLSTVQYGIFQNGIVPVLYGSIPRAKSTIPGLNRDPTIPGPAGQSPYRGLGPVEPTRLQVDLPHLSCPCSSDLPYGTVQPTGQICGASLAYCRSQNQLFVVRNMHNPATTVRRVSLPPRGKKIINCFDASRACFSTSRVRNPIV